MTGLRIRWRSERDTLAPGAEAGLRALDRYGALVWLAAGLIVLVALFARSYNTNWDDNTHLHPDERHMTGVTTGLDLPSGPLEYFDTAHSPLNPYNPPSNTGSFVYGTLPIFLAKFVAVAIGQDDFDHMVLVGRHLTALFDAITVGLVFLIGRRLYGSIAGLLGAILFAAAPLAIQHAHFFIVDSYLTTFTTAALYFSVRSMQDKRPRDAALAGLMLGLGMACKVTAVLAGPVVLVAIAWQLVAPVRRWAESRVFSKETKAALLSTALSLVVAGVCAFLAFRIAQPYAFNTPSLSHPSPFALNQKWAEDQKNQNKLLSGDVGFPPSIQWVGRSSYLYPFTEMTRWGAGPALSLAGWATAAYAAFRLFRRGDTRHLLPLLFLLVYFGFMGRQFSLYLRYFLPIYPVLAVLAGYGLIEVVSRASVLARRLQRPVIERAAYGMTGLVVLAGVLWGAAYFSIYTSPVTRIEASRWMYSNLPARSEIGVEHWDEGVPMQLPGSTPKDFQLFDLKLYDIDSREKVTELIDALSRADYITMSSNRLINSIPREPTNYPVTIRYYDLLFNGELGFSKLAEFTSYPRLFGIEFPDYRAQESQSSYDHPRVLVFKKDEAFSREHIEQLLAQGPFATSGLTPAQADKNGLLLKPADVKTQQEGGTWTDTFSSSGLAYSAPALVWFIALELAALAAVPLLFVVCARLPDRGYLLAKPLGLLLVAYPVWLLTSLKLIHFDQTSLLFSLVLLLTLAGYVAWRNREALLAWLSDHWVLVAVCEALFLLGFIAFLEIRMANPDLWHPFRGGEKPMDLAYLTAVARSTTLPAYDPWFSGGYINYYYFGQYLTASMLKLTTISPEVGYNLAIPTYFAMALGGAFSIAYNLAAFSRSALRRTAGMRAIPSWSIYAAGLLGALFVAVAGNLDGVDQLLDRLEHVSTLHLDWPIPVVDGLINAAGGVWQVVVHGKSLEPFDFWRSSRMMPPTIAITEFPYWSFLFADLHAHMMAIPFEVLTFGLCLSLVLNRRADSQGWQDWAVVGLLGLLVGSLRWLNSWDYPPFLLVAFSSVIIGERHLEGGAWAAAKRAGAKIVVLGALSFLLFKPFLDSYSTPVAGLHPSPEQTPIQQYLGHFGAYLALIACWLVFVGSRTLRATPLLRGAESRKAQLWVAVGACIVFAVSLAAFGTLLRGYPLVGVLVPFLALVLYFAAREFRLRRADSGPRLFVLMLVALGLGLSMGVDLVTLDGDIVRMNTVFKFYEHIWLAFALSAAFAAWYFVFVIWQPLLASLSRRARKASSPDASYDMPIPTFSQRTADGPSDIPERETIPIPTTRPGKLLAAGSPAWAAAKKPGNGTFPRVLAFAGSTGLALLILVVLIFPVFATGPRTNDRFAKLPATLDGEAYMAGAVYNDEKGKIELGYDLEGIRWLRQNVKGTPPIVEGRTPLYRWGGRFSIYTGLPTVLGWDWHQIQQRGKLAFMVDQRGAAVDGFYGNPDEENARRFLKQYGVRYVIVGQVERMYYPADGIAKFDRRLGGALDVVFENAQLRIYEVNEARLTALISTTPLAPIAPPRGGE